MVVSARAACTRWVCDLRMPDPSASRPLGLGDSTAAEAIDIVDNISNTAGDGNTPLGAGMSDGMDNMTDGDRDFVDGVPVTHAFVLLSDGRPWVDVTDNIRRPDSTLIGNYLGTVEQAFSIMIGTSLDVDPPSAFILDPDLMDKLKADPLANDGVPSGNFHHIQDAGDLAISSTTSSAACCVATSRSPRRPPRARLPPGTRSPTATPSPTRATPTCSTSRTRT